MITDDVIAELERTLQAMKEYRTNQKGQTYFTPVWNTETKVYDFIKKPYLWSYIDANHSAAGRASMDCSKVLAKWRQAPKIGRTVK
jgi:hypothetical protein